jgi:hypothetical protein
MRITRRCVACRQLKVFTQFYFRRRGQRYSWVCQSCRKVGVNANHTHRWKRVYVQPSGIGWRWKYRCQVCAEIRAFLTTYAPASHKHGQESIGIRHEPYAPLSTS